MRRLSDLLPANKDRIESCTSGRENVLLGGRRIITKCRVEVWRPSLAVLRFGLTPARTRGRRPQAVLKQSSS